MKARESTHLGKIVILLDANLMDSNQPPKALPLFHCLPFFQTRKQQSRLDHLEVSLSFNATATTTHPWILLVGWTRLTRFHKASALGHIRFVS